MELNSFLKNSKKYWSSKPIWCQPWSIILTGVIIITFASFILPFLWLKVLVIVLIFLWWYLFLIFAPSFIEEDNNFS